MVVWKYIPWYGTIPYPNCVGTRELFAVFFSTHILFFYNDMYVHALEYILEYIMLM